MDFVSWKDRKGLATALKQIYRATDAVAAEQALTAFEAGPWGQRYPAIGQSWRRAWSEVIPFFAFPDEVRRIVYTTNAIEALNSKLRRAVRARGHFPSDEAATKLLYLILNRSEKEWKMPPREWSMAKAQFAVIFGERFIRAMAAQCSTARPHTEILTVPRATVQNLPQPGKPASHGPGAMPQFVWRYYSSGMLIKEPMGSQKSARHRALAPSHLFTKGFARSNACSA